MSNNTLVLQRDVKVLDAIDAVSAAATELNRELRAEWYYAELTEGDGMRTFVWDEPVWNYGTIHLVEDLVVPTLFVSNNAVDRVRDKVEAALRKHVHPVPEEVLQMDAERGIPSRTTALMRLGLGEERRFDERTLRILVGALESSDVEERRAAVMGMFLLKWRAFEPAVERALAAERDKSLRDQLTYTLQLCRGAIFL